MPRVAQRSAVVPGCSWIHDSTTKQKDLVPPPNFVPTPRPMFVGHNLTKKKVKMPPFVPSVNPPPKRSSPTQGELVPVIKIGKDDKHYVYDGATKQWLVRENNDKPGKLE